MAKVEQLTTILKRLNEGEDPARVREEARAFLATIDPADLSIAEQQLLEAGLSKEDLRGLCSVHMELLSGQPAGVKNALPPGHVVHTLVSEHEMILAFLDELTAVNEAIQVMAKYDGEREEFGKLHHIAEHLVEAEAHHQREEEVLFPELERRGVTGPPQIMRLEHQELRARKKALKALAEGVAQMDFGEFKGRLDDAAGYIVPTLRDHIFKEDHILYPTALKVIDDPAVWKRLKQECDRIGYCCFTPSA
jgi:DUF438 domain-containing protein